MSGLARVVVFGLGLLGTCERPASSDSPQTDHEVSTTAASSLEERLSRIENGLVPPFQFRGESTAPRRLGEAMAEAGVPGLALAIVDDCDVVWAGGWGTLGSGDAPITRSTPFQVGSTSKMVTATVAMTMASEGRIGLDQPVNGLLTTWKLPENELTRRYPVLVRHLLSHSAGLTRTAFWFERSAPMPPLAAILQGETGGPVIAVEEAPGSRAISSNSGFLVLQSVLEETSGLALSALASKHVFTPLGMSASAFEPVEPAFLELAAANHRRDGSAIEGKAPLIPGAPGGLWSSAEDLARLIAELMRSWQGRSERLFPREVARQMLSVELGDMGLGLHIRGQGAGFSVQQAGGGIGSQSRVIAHPDLCRGAAIVMNTDRGRRVLVETLAAVGREYDWPDLPLRLAKTAVSATNLQRLAGRYRYDALPDVFMVFSVEGSTLFAQAGERDPFPLIATSELVFIAPRSATEMRFDAPERGAALGVTISTAGLYGSHLTRVDSTDS